MMRNMLKKSSMSYAYMFKRVNVILYYILEKLKSLSFRKYDQLTIRITISLDC